ncbi:MAG: hypothetical protein IJ087_12405 [Eggerthellaceae bacterium]|nr:hypothetical protein [Eggerthellaceae bacterium]
MCEPDRCGVFSKYDVEFANRLLQSELKQEAKIRVDLERPTYAENSDFGEIKVSWSARGPFKRMVAKASGL